MSAPASPATFSGSNVADVVVLGGGIFGHFTALTLAEAGRSVVLLDRGTVWREASAVNAGSLGIQNKIPALVPYSLWAWELWATLGDHLGEELGVSRSGGYKVALSESEAERLFAVAEQQEARGLIVERLEGIDLRHRAPWLSNEVVAATFSTQDGFGVPTLTGPALRRALERHGVQIVEAAEVVDIVPGDVVLVKTRAKSFRTRQLAITAGAWSSRLGAMVGCQLPISLDVNMVSVTETAPPTIGGLTSHARGILTLKQVANGSCLIGGGWQGIGSLEDARKGVDCDQLTHNLRLAMRVVPGLALLNVLRSWAGYEGVTPDSLPYLGRLGNHPNIYCAACARGGFTLAPLLGQLLGELMTSGETSRPIDVFNPQRFAHENAPDRRH